MCDMLWSVLAWSVTYFGLNPNTIGHSLVLTVSQLGWSGLQPCTAQKIQLA